MRKVIGSNLIYYNPLEQGYSELHIYGTDEKIKEYKEHTMRFALNKLLVIVGRNSELNDMDLFNNNSIVLPFADDEEYYGFYDYKTKTELALVYDAMRFALINGHYSFKDVTTALDENYDIVRTINPNQYNFNLNLDLPSYCDEIEHTKYLLPITKDLYHFLALESSEIFNISKNDQMPFMKWFDYSAGHSINIEDYKNELLSQEYDLKDIQYTIAVGNNLVRKRQNYEKKGLIKD